MKDSKMEDFKKMCKKGLEWANSIEEHREKIAKEFSSYLESLDGSDREAILAKEQEKPIWSADDMALSPPKMGQEYYLNGYTKCYWNGDKEDLYQLNRGQVFRKKKRGDLQEQKEEVDYLMKKMACESNSSNDWRKFGDPMISQESWHILYTKDEGFRLYNADRVIDFNKPYFRIEKDAQSCLDKLLEKYEGEKLRKIWGVE